MGPLAGIGDSIIWAALMPLIISIFIPMAKGGNVIGSIGPLVLYTAITLYISWTLVNKSHTLGRNSILSLLKDGKIKQVIYSANVLGMMMMGALSASYVKIASPMTFKSYWRCHDCFTRYSRSNYERVTSFSSSHGYLFLHGKKGPRYGIIIGTIVLVSLVTSFFGLL